MAAAVIALAVWGLYGNMASAVYPFLLGFFEWMETTWFGVIGKTWGAAFAFVEAIHLLGLAVLGGCVIASDGRLLGLLLTDVDASTLFDRTHRVFVWALSVLIFTGVFMACGVATKIYYLPVYWFKMLALIAGILFHFFIRRPLLQHELDELNPVVTKLVAVASILVWLMVAATGRWIGFSG
ncbi:MAG: hypothetical protein OXE78_05385 [Gammaproteobacteria bacterium]|nr:hypothetical protein [Gammaproteobacteria bacterium]MCY4356351.1 hypothetical protein [Gammaproteobacteria bacterium]